MTIVAIAAAVIFAGCIEYRIGLESKLQHIKTPIWDEEDLEIYKYQHANPDAPVISYTLTITYPSKGYPPFYKGPTPLEHNVTRTPAGRFLCHEFDGFQNHFIYQETILVGARTTDDFGQVVAEARLSYFVTEKNEQEIEAEEFHYGPDSKLIFKCKSQIDPSTEFKTKETKKIGKKIRDYYFMWPI